MSAETFPFLSQTRSGLRARFRELPAGHGTGGLVLLGEIEGVEGPQLWRRDGRWRESARPHDWDILSTTNHQPSTAQ